ncbi:MAG: antifreeze protein [Rhodobacteraceae bacterium]|nr:antifreeze protein [Paracoccaceae bacterium]
MWNPWTAPLTLMRLQLQVSVMLMEAGTVMWLRSLGVAGLWNVTPAERARMVTEKVGAFGRSAAAGLASAAAGRPAERTVAAMLAPVARKTRANARRLARRGPAR